MQCSVISGAEPRCLPLDLKILPQYLKDLNYTNYHIGKWHLGSCKNACRPLQRGFHYSKGFFLGKTDPYGYDYREIVSRPSTAVISIWAVQWRTQN